MFNSMAMQNEERQYFGIYGEVTENNDNDPKTLLGQILKH
jgi:hypothetical protein